MSLWTILLQRGVYSYVGHGGRVVDGKMDTTETIEYIFTCNLVGHGRAEVPPSQNMRSLNWQWWQEMVEPHICKCKCDSTVATGELCNTTVPPHHLSRCKSPLRLDWVRENSLKHIFEHNCHDISRELASHFEWHHIPNKRFPTIISAWETFDKHIWNFLVISLLADGLAVLRYLQTQWWPILWPIYIYGASTWVVIIFHMSRWDDCPIQQHHGISLHNIDQLESQYTSGVLYLQRGGGAWFELLNSLDTTICGSSPMGLEQQMIVI